MGITALIFLGVAAGCLALAQGLVPRLLGSAGGVSRRIKEEFDREQQDPHPRSLYKDLDVAGLTSAQEYEILGGVKRRLPRPSLQAARRYVERLLEEADIPLRAGHAVLVSLAAGLALGLAGAWALHVTGAVAGLVVGAALPAAFAHLRRKRRRDRLVAQLPAAFELMGRVIRAGQSVPQAFQAVGEAFEDPLAGEFTRCQQQQNLGLPPEVVLQEMARRWPVLELRIFVMAVVIQRQTGGPLSEVLDRLAVLLRGRLRLRQQFRTLTAEGRLQGITLAVLPFVVFAAMYSINRSYAAVLLDHTGLLWGMAALMVIGLLWIRRIVHPEV